MSTIAWLLIGWALATLSFVAGWVTGIEVGRHSASPQRLDTADILALREAAVTEWKDGQRTERPA